LPDRGDTQNRAKRNFKENVKTMQIYKKKFETKKLKKEGKKNLLLVTLAQLSSNYPKPQPPNTRETLAKRAKAKYFTQAVTKKLAMLNSPLKRSYNNTYFGCSNLLLQTGDIITTKYCNNRWCLVCNRIRTAKLICGYKETLQALSDLQFVTLTIRNVKKEALKQTIEGMQHNFSDIIKTLNRKQQRLNNVKRTLKGLRKVEVTFNAIRNDYHPHLHVLISGLDNAIDIVTAWLKHYPTAEPYCQKIQKADDKTFMELFKYYTKITTNKITYITALDTIFQAMRNKRVYQPFGILKNVTEDIETLQAQITDLEAAEKIWMWESCDWIDHETGECLTDYEPSENVKQLINNIKHC